MGILKMSRIGDKMKKGFTLVELLGIITIIAMMLLVTVPSLMTTLRRNTEKEETRFLNTVYLATETYVQENRRSYPDFRNPGDSITINTGTLIDNYMLASNTVDPVTKKKLTKLEEITVTLDEDCVFSFKFTRK